MTVAQLKHILNKFTDDVTIRIEGCNPYDVEYKEYSDGSKKLDILFNGCYSEDDALDYCEYLNDFPREEKNYTGYKVVCDETINTPDMLKEKKIGFSIISRTIAL